MSIDAIFNQSDTYGLGKVFWTFRPFSEGPPVIHGLASAFIYLLLDKVITKKL